MQLGKLDVSQCSQCVGYKTAANRILENQSVTAEKQNAERSVFGRPPDPENEIAAPIAVGSGDKKEEQPSSPALDSASDRLRTTGNAREISAILADVYFEIATAKLAELEFQAHRLGALVRAGEIPVTDAADVLYFAAVADGLVNAHGDDAIQAIMVAGMKGGAA
ncbi:MAG TPA: hypothetical protein PKD49_05815 [Hyphomicrobium sp.]|nr:hypothetical protein [Hyphomicrobium sp.]